MLETLLTLTPDAPQSAGGCTLENCFDATSAAQAFAQFAGVMTGFAVAVCVLLMQRLFDERRSPDSGEKSTLPTKSPLVTVLASVAGLGLSTFCFSVAAGVEAPGAKAQSQYLVATAAFVIGASMLLYGVWQFVTEALDERSVRAARNGQLLLIPVLYVYLVVTAADVSDTSAAVGELLAARMAPLWSGLAVIVGLAGSQLLRPVSRRPATSLHANRVAVAGLCITIVIVAIFATWVASLSSLETALPTGAVYGIVFLSLGYLTLYIAALSEE